MRRILVLLVLFFLLSGCAPAQDGSEIRGVTATLLPPTAASSIESQPAPVETAAQTESTSTPLSPATEASTGSSQDDPSPEPNDPAAPLVSLRLELADPDWDGEVIPDGQQCNRQGGEDPSTPLILVGEIPAGADAIILEFSDGSYRPMDDGGHGVIGFMIPEGTRETPIPPVPGHTFDLPEGFFLVQEHQAAGFDTAGAYMPPCSGGVNHAYYVTVKAVEVVSLDDNTFNVLGQGILELGEY